MKKVLILFLILLISIDLVAENGIYLKNETIDSKGKKSTGEIFITPTKLKMSTVDHKKRASDILFFNDTKLMQMVDHKKEEVTEITKEDMAKMKAQMDEVKKQLDEINQQLEDMPEGQRKMMKGIMSGQIESLMKKGNMIEIKYTKTGRTDKINGWNCEEYIATMNDEKISEVWVTNFSNIDFKMSDFKIMYDYAEYMTSFTGDFLKGLNFKGIEPDYDGYPIKTITFYKDKQISETFVLEYKRMDINNSVFTVPADYDKEKAFK